MASPANSSPSTSSPGALTGLRVLDLSRVLAGPYCGQMLADHGASVLKIEPPMGDETRLLGPPFIGDSAAYFHALNRNKQAIALDLTRDDARAVLLRLLETADVLIENFLTGTMEKWGLGYTDVLAAKFPHLVYCRISGFGPDGPLGGLPGYDAVLQAMGGVMSVNGDANGGATRLGMPLVDISTGMHAAFGVMLALHERQRSGRGQLVDLCLYDTALSMLIPHAANWFAAGVVPKRTGSAHPNISPYDKYSAKDGEIFLGVVNDGQFRKFCAVVGRDWASDARFAAAPSRLANRALLKSEIETTLLHYDSAELCTKLMAAGVPAGPVQSVDQALEHPHTAHRQMKQRVDGNDVLGVPVKLSRTPGSVRSAPPVFGRDTANVLAAAGYRQSEIDRLIAAGALVTQRTRGGKA